MAVPFTLKVEIVNVEFPAKISWVDRWAHDRNENTAAADRKKQGPAGVKVFWLEARLINQAGVPTDMRFGMKAAVTFRFDIPDALSIPRRAVFYRAGQAYVYRSGSDDAVPVSLGATHNGRVHVIAGLKEGEKVRVSL